MAQDFKRAYASSISNSSGSPTTLVTSNSNDALISIRCVNKTGSAANATVLIASGELIITSLKTHQFLVDQV